MLGPEQFRDVWPIGKLFLGTHEWGQSVQKIYVLVCEGSLCPRKLPEVSGSGLGEAGRYTLEDQTLYNVEKYKDSLLLGANSG